MLNVARMPGYPIEHMFDYHGRPMATPDELMALTRTHLSDEDTERLVGWIAWRLGRNQALAGAGPAHSRLAHVVTHWLDDARREQLARWLTRRIETGRPPVPR